MILAKIHEAEGNKLLALCDEQILGKKFEEDDKVLDVPHSFYGGEVIADEQLTRLVKSVYIINAVGEASTGFLKKMGLVESHEILSVAGIPHCQVLMVKNL